MEQLLVFLSLLGLAYCAPHAVANGLEADYPVKSIALDGSNSSGKFYKWKKVGGARGWRLSNTGSAVATLGDIKPGIGVFELTVTDIGGKEDKREVVVVIKCNTGVCSGSKFQNEDGECVNHKCPKPAKLINGKCRGCPKYAHRVGGSCECKRGYVMKANSCYLTASGAAALKKEAAKEEAERKESVKAVRQRPEKRPKPIDDKKTDIDFDKLFELLDAGVDLGDILFK